MSEKTPFRHFFYTGAYGQSCGEWPPPPPPFPRLISVLFARLIQFEYDSDFSLNWYIILIEITLLRYKTFVILSNNIYIMIIVKLQDSQWLSVLIL